MSVPGHGVRQGTVTFMLKVALMNNIIDAIGPLQCSWKERVS